jgi:hypothetical protein
VDILLGVDPEARRGLLDSAGMQAEPGTDLETKADVIERSAIDKETKLTVMSELIFLVEEAPEGGYTARALGESIFTEADDLSSLHEQVRDAVRCHFEEDRQPKVIRPHLCEKK